MSAERQSQSLTTRANHHIPRPAKKSLRKRLTAHPLSPRARRIQVSGKNSDVSGLANRWAPSPAKRSLHGNCPLATSRRISRSHARYSKIGSLRSRFDTATRTSGFGFHAPESRGRSSGSMMRCGRNPRAVKSADAAAKKSAASHQRRASIRIRPPGQSDERSEMDQSQHDDRADERPHANSVELRGERQMPRPPAEEGGRVIGRGRAGEVVKERHLGDQNIPGDDPPGKGAKSQRLREKKRHNDRQERVPVPPFFAAGRHAALRRAGVRG